MNPRISLFSCYLLPALALSPPNLLISPTAFAPALPSLGTRPPPSRFERAGSSSRQFTAGQRVLGLKGGGPRGMTSEGPTAEVAETFKFGKFDIPEGHIFWRSKSGSTAAFVNLRPIVPGHVLVCPARVVPRMKELTDEEYSDLWMGVRRVADKIEEKFGASALNVAVQDGKSAGQSVPHVHVHILPRAAGDFERNDDVYDAIEEFDARPHKKAKLEVPDDSERRDRTSEEMEEEARTLKAMF